MKNVVKCDTWCKLQNLVNHRVFERKLHPKPSGRGHVCPDVTNRRPSSSRGYGTEAGLACVTARGWKKSELRMQGASRHAVVNSNLVILLVVPLRRDHSLSLSISISGGKETNKDSLSNGEGTGRSPT
ncbi:hypothetical protein N665_0537s0003 [Sinapis alba]|nr:hypothetical protein N665_0537s0003 [Sinapis alba]